MHGTSPPATTPGARRRNGGFAANAMRHRRVRDSGKTHHRQGEDSRFSVGRLGRFVLAACAWLRDSLVTGRAWSGRTCVDKHQHAFPFLHHEPAFGSHLSASGPETRSFVALDPVRTGSARLAMRGRCIGATGSEGVQNRTSGPIIAAEGPIVCTSDETLVIR